MAAKHNNTGGYTLEDHLAGVRTAVIVLIVCVLAATFGFPYLAPIAAITAVYAFYKGKGHAHRCGKYWRAIGWIATLVAIALMINLLALSPVP